MAGTSNTRIPSGLGLEEQHVYHKLLEVVEERKAKNIPPPNIVTITDIGKDVDDMVAMVLLKELHRLGLVVLKGFVANLDPAEQRALLGRGALNSLGLGDVPIAVGTRADTKSRIVNPYEFDCSFMASEPLPSGPDLLSKLFEDAKNKDHKHDNQVTLLLISALQDINDFTKLDGKLLKGATKRVVLQGGYTVTKEATNEDGHTKITEKVTAIPDAANNHMNITAANEFHNFMSENEIPSVVYTRVAALATPIPDQLCKDMKATGHPIGAYLNNAQVAMDLTFYKTACNPDPAKRFRPAMDQTWYLKNKSSYFNYPHPEVEPLPVGREAGKYFDKLIAYDALAALGSAGDDVLEHLKISRPSDGFKKPLHQIVGTAATAGQPADPGMDGSAMSVAIRALVLGSLLACQQNIW